MKILLTVDPEIPVPPKLYGGIERIVNGLAKGYRDAGHEVYLIAHPESECSFTVTNFPWPALHSRGSKNIFKNAFFLQSIINKIKPHIIHSFSRLLYAYPVFLFNKTPVVQSYQRGVNAKSTGTALKAAGKKLLFTSCAAHMIKHLPNKQAFTPIFNFTEVDYFTADKKIVRDSLIFLGRIEDIKGTYEAIQAAIITNEKIVIAGNIQPGHENYFEEKIKPLLDNPLVEYVGPVNDEQKKYYLQKAKAMLFPIKWEEPFGIVLAEALACGTPVIGFNRGSVPEVIKDGINGFIVDTTEQMAAAIKKLPQLNMDVIREDAVKRFSLSTITDQYLQVFAKLLQQQKVD